MIQVGQNFPNFTAKAAVGEEVMEINQDLLKDKTVVLFGVPGAFTPTCHQNHLPSYVSSFDAFKKKGVDMVICIAANDPFVLMGWGKVTQATDKITFISDWDASIVHSLGLDIDLSAHGLGVRSKRFSMLLQNGVVKALHVEEAPGTCVVTTGENLLKDF